MVKKLRRVEKYFLLMFLSLLTFWRGKAEASSYRVCCGDNETLSDCCDSIGGLLVDDVCFVSQ